MKKQKRGIDVPEGANIDILTTMILVDKCNPEWVKEDRREFKTSCSFPALEGAGYNSLKNKSLFEIFETFWGEDIWDLIHTQTNANKIMKKKIIKKWKISILPFS